MSIGLSTAALLAANIVERAGAYAGFAAFLGLAILALLYFSQARDVRRLREWAGRAPERAAELEARGAQPVAQRVVAQSKPAAAKPAVPQTAAGRAAQPPPKPGQPAQPGVAKPGQPVTPSKPLPSPAVAATTAGKVNQGAGTEQAEPDLEDKSAPQDDQETDSAPQVPEPAGAAASGNGPVKPPPTVDQPTVAHTPVEPLEPLEPLPPLSDDHYLPGTSFRDTSSRRKKPLTQRARNVHIPQLRYLLASVAIFLFVVVGLGAVTGVIDIGGGDSGSDSGPTRAERQAQRAERTAPANVDPSQVTVAVLNGTTVTGLAYTVSQEAQSSGFVLGNVTNAATTNQQSTEVLYAPGQRNAARVVADRLGISSVAPVDSVNSEIAGSADAVVLVGADRS